jgi:hypothetical protein
MHVEDGEFLPYFPYGFLLPGCMKSPIEINLFLVLHEWRIVSLDFFCWQGLCFAWDKSAMVGT